VAAGTIVLTRAALPTITTADATTAEQPPGPHRPPSTDLTGERG